MTEPIATTIEPEATPQPAAKPIGTPAPAVDPRDFDAKLRDPEFAAAEVKKYQRKQNELTQRIKPLESLEGVARAVGGGDVAVGLQKIINLADRAYRIEQNPEWNRTVEDLLAGRRPGAGGGESAGAADEYLTPEERKIQDLEAKVAAFEGRLVSHDTRMVRGEMQAHLESFFASEIGQALDAEERQGLVEAIGKQFSSWGRTAQGRDVMSSLSLDTIETIALKHLKDQGTLLSVSERLHAAKAQRLSGAATDRPSLGSRAAADQPDFGKSTNVALDALKYASSKYLEPGERQSLKW